MTDLELAEKYIHLIQTRDWNDPELQRTGKQLHKVANVLIKVKSECFLGTGTIMFYDAKLPRKDFCLGTLNAAEFVHFHGMRTERVSDVVFYKQALFCIKSDLNEILAEVKEQYRIVASQGVARNFLINPRKDVVEWALAHKNELGISKEDIPYGLKYQTIPELKELILNNLNEKEE